MLKLKEPKIDKKYPLHKGYLYSLYKRKNLCDGCLPKKSHALLACIFAVGLKDAFALPGLNFSIILLSRIVSSISLSFFLDFFNLAET
jgi:hypothetical protein